MNGARCKRSIENPIVTLLKFIGEIDKPSLQVVFVAHNIEKDNAKLIMTSTLKKTTLKRLFLATSKAIIVFKCSLTLEIVIEY